MRGKVFQHGAEVFSAGITPACAGKRMVFAGRKSRTWDHPRVCGEKFKPFCLRQLCQGSPPRMRGKGVQPRDKRVAMGITPAYAGKSRSSARPHHSHRDHPRACGEKTEYRALVTAHQGSPPRVRGKVCDLTIIRVHHGITPAYAGKRLKRSHSIGHFSYILCLFHSVLHRASASGGSRAGPRAPPCLPAQNTVPV